MMKEGNGMKERNIFLRGLILFGWMIISQLPIGTFLVVLKFTTTLPVWQVLLIVIAYLAITLGMMWWVRSYYLKHTVEQKKSIRPKDVGIAVAWTLLIRLCVIIGAYLLLWTTGSMETANDQAIFGDSNGAFDPLQFGHPIAFIAFCLSLIVFGPYMEELIYRGIFKETMFKRESFWLPLIITSIVFSSMHLSTSVISFLIYFSMGAVLYLSYDRRRYIGDSMMVHMLNNAFAVLPLIYMYVESFFK